MRLLRFVSLVARVRACMQSSPVLCYESVPGSLARGRIVLGESGVKIWVTLSKEARPASWHARHADPSGLLAGFPGSLPYGASLIEDNRTTEQPYRSPRHVPEYGHSAESGINRHCQLYSSNCGAPSSLCWM